MIEDRCVMLTMADWEQGSFKDSLRISVILLLVCIEWLTRGRSPRPRTRGPRHAFCVNMTSITNFELLHQSTATRTYLCRYGTSTVQLLVAVVMTWWQANDRQDSRRRTYGLKPTFVAMNHHKSCLLLLASEKGNKNREWRRSISMLTKEPIDETILITFFLAEIKPG